MKSIIIGNGIDIQFGGEDYFSKNIINRAIENAKLKINHRYYPEQIQSHLKELMDLAKRILDNPTKYKEKVWKEDENPFRRFIDYYSMKKVEDCSDIGFEDYFLIQKIFFNIDYDAKEGNFIERERYYEWLRKFYIDSIYNNGKVNSIEYPDKMKLFLEKFNNVFTTNYDRNLEKLTGKEVYYLHGAFHIIDEKYNADSSMNKALGNKLEMGDKEYLYSTALTTYSGTAKLEKIKRPEKINLFLNNADKLIAENKRLGIEMPPVLKQLTDASKECDTKYVYPNQYGYEKLKESMEEITILGLSPINDEHITDIIKNNFSTINYYLFKDSQFENNSEFIKEEFENKEVNILNVQDLWDSFVNA